MKSIICFVLSLLVLQVQLNGIVVCAQEVASAPVILTPLHGGVEVVTKNGARIVRKVRRVRYYRRGPGTHHIVRRYHVVRHTHAANPNRTRVGNNIVTRPSSAPKAPHSPSVELPRNIVDPLIIHGIDNLKAGHRYIEVTERDGKLFIKEGGDVDPNGQFLEVEEEDGVWKIKGTDIVVDFKNTFDISKVPPAVKAYLNPATDFVSPGQNYVQYQEDPDREVIPILASTIPPEVHPGDSIELYQVPVEGGQMAPGTWETMDIPVRASSVVPGGQYETVESGVPVVGTGAVPMTAGVPGIVEGPGVRTGGIPVGEGPVGGVVVPGDPMTVGGVPVGRGPGGVPVAGIPAAGTPMQSEPIKEVPPVIPPIAEIPPAPTTVAPPVAGIPAPGMPMSEPRGAITPFAPIGSSAPPAAGGGGWGFPVGALLPAALLGGLVPLALMGRGGSSGGNHFVPYPVGQGGTTVVTGSTPGVTVTPQVSPPVTTPPTCTPPPTCNPPPTCGPPPICNPPPPCTPPPCPPPTCGPPPCPPPPVCTPPPCPPPICMPPPVCLPPPCLPPPCGPLPPGCYGPGIDDGGYGFGCNNGYGYGNGCDNGYGNGCDNGYGYGNGCDNGYGYGNGYGNGCGNAGKFGSCPPDGTSTSFKEQWWSQHGRSYDYNGPCAGSQAACASSMMGSGMGGYGGNCAPPPCAPPPCAPPPCAPPPCAPY